MFHKIILVGNLGRDPELRYTPGGQAVTNLSVATNRTYNDSDGNPVKQTVWFRIAVWGKQAEAAAQYLRKGRAVLVEGRLNADASGNPKVFERGDGTHGASYELTAETVRFLGSAPTGANGAAQDQPVDEAAQEEIPF